ncbi:MAG: hypothetical protein RLZZ248_1858 [Bacteroidota bacterium]|jgi:glucuronate isomerase
MSIFNEDFLLENNFAQKLYYDYVQDQPIIDYHSHLPPQEIADDIQFESITAVWLKGDHYKWRSMRALGVEEHYITGKASDLEKFSKWAWTLPQTLRNPLFHWSQLELKNIFGVKEYLNPNNAPRIFDICNEQLQTPELSTQAILSKYQVEITGTTDDPCDDLSAHRKVSASSNSLQLLPTFRPDNALNIEDGIHFTSYIKKLEEVSEIKIRAFDDLLAALAQRIDYFAAHGCKFADHGLTQLPPIGQWTIPLEEEFKNFLINPISFSQPAIFKGKLLFELCQLYHQKNWIQQFHLGAQRNNSTTQFFALGKDSGFDSIGDWPQANRLVQFLDGLEQIQSLSKTILYNLNPSDNAVLASIAGSFNNTETKGKIQFGPAWWFLDQLDGMERQINELSNIGLLSTFIGMTTDSRSFLSFERHDYFRRLLCNILGKDMKKGRIPNDMDWIGGLARSIAYENIKEFITT